jgi:hypothetical protein
MEISYQPAQQSPNSPSVQPTEQARSNSPSAQPVDVPTVMSPSDQPSRQLRLVPVVRPSRQPLLSSVMEIYTTATTFTMFAAQPRVHLYLGKFKTF